MVGIRTTKFFAVSFGLAAFPAVCAAQNSIAGAGFGLESHDFPTSITMSMIMEEPEKPSDAQFYGIAPMGGDSNSSLNRGQLGAGSIASGRLPRATTPHVVPLPPAAFAGLGLLVGAAGFRAIRRHARG